MDGRVHARRSVRSIVFVGSVCVSSGIFARLMFSTVIFGYMSLCCLSRGNSTKSYRPSNLNFFWNKKQEAATTKRNKEVSMLETMTLAESKN
jgi:hypothetical protein